jgi:hypothetical protein
MVVLVSSKRSPPVSLIDVPGSELLRVHDLLQRTQDLMDSGPVASMGHLVQLLGQRDLQSAGQRFEKSWSDGRHVIGKDLGDIRDASKAVADAFQQTDEAVINALGDPGAQSGSTPSSAAETVAQEATGSSLPTVTSSADHIAGLAQGTLPLQGRTQ